MERSSSSVPEQRLFVDFVPLDRVVSSNEAEFFIVELQGFRKEDINIRIDDFGNLKITGERPLVGNRWSRFVKEFQVPDHCDASEIRAKVENGLLQIELPKFGAQGDTAKPEASPETRDVGQESGLRQRAKSRTMEPVGASIGQPLMEDEKKTEDQKLEEISETGKELQGEFRSRSRIIIIGILVVMALVGTGIIVYYKQIERMKN